jgi:hypothetical protein
MYKNDVEEEHIEIEISKDPSKQEELKSEESSRVEFGSSVHSLLFDNLDLSNSD